MNPPKNKLKTKMISQSLKNYRANNNLSQKDVAKMLGITFQSISHYEKEIRIPKRKIQKKMEELNILKKEDF